MHSVVVVVVVAAAASASASCYRDHHRHHHHAWPLWSHLGDNDLEHEERPRRH